MTTVADIRAWMDGRYPPETAEEWDSVGLVCGDPHASVRRVLFALDPRIDVVYEAAEIQADMIVTHHPLFLTPVHSVARDTLGGQVIHEAISQGVAIFNAHTNADIANPGVSDALADLLGLVDCHPIVAQKVPGGASGTGLGRIGELTKPMELAEFAQFVSRAIPPSAAGIRVAGDVTKVITSVAVCGGSGDSLFPLVVNRADVYVTSDLKHHRTLDHPREVCALIDVPHFSSEWPWVEQVARFAANEMPSSVECVVSKSRTDPWTATYKN